MKLHVGTFAYWRGIFKKEISKQENKFIELKINPAETSLKQFVIECPTGHKIICSFTLKIEEAKILFKLLGLIT